LDEPVRTLESIDVMELMRLLPHRYPFLMIDRIVEIDGDRSAIGIKNVTINEPHFQGHFLGRPVMPGVLLIEAMAQTAGAICIKHRGGDAPGVVYFMSIDKAKFRRPVVPGDTVEFHVTKQRQRGAVWRFWAEAKVAGGIVAEAEVTAMVGQE
jgi:3-hydroxyacyl-[acyl-carrier-protein] dehydratase